MNTTHVEINGTLQPTRIPFKSTSSSTITGDFQSLKTGVFDRTVLLTNMTDNLTKLHNRLSSTNEIATSSFNNSRNSDDEKSSSEKSSLPLQTKLSISSTTISRSSSASSNDDSQVIPSGIVNDFHHSFRSSEIQSETINSNIDSTKIETITESQSGFFSRLFAIKSSTTKNKNSRTCLIM